MPVDEFTRAANTENLYGKQRRPGRTFPVFRYVGNGTNDGAKSGLAQNSDILGGRRCKTSRSQQIRGSLVSTATTDGNMPDPGALMDGC